MMKQNMIIAIMMMGNIHQKLNPNHTHGNIWDHLLSFLWINIRADLSAQPFSPPLCAFCVSFDSLGCVPLPWPIILVIIGQQSMTSPSPGQQVFIISVIF